MPAPKTSDPVRPEDLQANRADFVDIESKQVRHYHRQCQKCWKRRGENVKLFVCSACKVTSYCSVQCQKADWAFHKKPCRDNAKFRERMAKEDAQLLRAAGLESNSSPSSSNSNNNTSHTISRNTTNTNKANQGEDGPLLASTVMTEIAEFLKRFRPMICLAGFRCLGIARGNPNAWKTHVFVLRVERIPNPPKTSRPWQRYQVVDAISIPVAALLEAQGNDFKEFLKQGEAYHKENVRVGCIGTIMTFINCDSAGQDLRLVSWAGYGKDTWSEVGPAEEDWFLPLYNSVERISGRPEEKEESYTRRHLIED